MTIELLLYTQISSIIGFVVALFVLYRVLVSSKDATIGSKDATIELLKEKNGSLIEKLSQAKDSSSDVLVDSLSKRIHVLTDELARLNQEKEINEKEIYEKETLDHVLREALKLFQLISSAEHAMANRDLDAAISFADKALALEPQGEQASIVKSMALKRKGYVIEAVNILSTLIADNQNSARAFYNRACYKALAGYPKQEVLSDLKAAISLEESYKQYAAHDADFISVYTDPDFKGLVA